VSPSLAGSAGSSRGAFARLRPFLSIAVNTYREAVRSKILYSILFFAVFLIVFSLVLGQLSLNQSERVIKDVGLFAVSLFGNLMAVFLGASFVYKEIERRSIYNIVSKPIHRSQYFLGKFVGILMTLLLAMAVMQVTLVVLLWLRAGRIHENVLIAFAPICFEVVIVTTIALLFSSFSTPYLSGFLAFGAFIAGRSAELLSRLASRTDNPVLRVGVDVMDRIVPALYIFDVSTQVTYELPIPGAFVLHAGIYTVCYAGLVLILGTLIFSRRDFV
jgi:ABC-type transport system involved in multi-copper enzyme maturation permease subunit